MSASSRLTWGKPTGGQGVYTNALTRHLARRGVEATVFPGVPPLTNGRGQLIPGEIVVSIMVRVALKDWARRLRLDLVHVQSGPGGVTLLEDPEIPVVCTAHHLYSQQHRYLGRKTVHRLLMEMEKKSLQISKKVIAVSESTRTELRRSYLIEPEKIETIHPGVDPQYSEPAQVPELRDSVLFVGRIGQRKGIADLAQAFRKLKNNVPDAKLYVIGRSSLWPTSRRLLRELTSIHGVHWLGRVSRRDLVHWYHRAEVLVLPSLFEGLGLVSLEAMATGTPIVGTRVPGTVDAVQHGITGLLAEPHDPSDLARCLTRVLQDEDLRRNMGREAKRRAKARFNWQECTTKTMKVYEAAAAR
ncbi:MAG: glycosyltransferase family 4 protein [Thermoplasmata archaeon]